MNEKSPIKCIFCSFAAPDVDALRAHSAECAGHPLFAEVRRLRDQLAAAPKLLEALEAVASERDFVVRCNDHIQEVVRAAIAEAEVVRAAIAEAE